MNTRGVECSEVDQGRLTYVEKEEGGGCRRRGERGRECEGERGRILTPFWRRGIISHVGFRAE